MAKSYKIAVIGGDGTGPEVTAEAVKALKAAAGLCFANNQRRRITGAYNKKE